MLLEKGLSILQDSLKTLTKLFPSPGESPLLELALGVLPGQEEGPPGLRNTRLTVGGAGSDHGLGHGLGPWA